MKIAFNLINIKPLVSLKIVHATGYHTKVPGEKRVLYAFHILLQLFPDPYMKHRYTRASGCCNRRTDENRVEWSSFKTFDGEIGFERFPLSPESIPIHRYFDKTQRMDAFIINMGRHQYHASTGSKYTAGKRADWLVHLILINEPGDSCRFTTGNSESVASCQIFGIPDLKNFR